MSFGGHSCAAGLKLSRDLVPTLKKNLEELIRSQIPLDQLRPKLMLDAPLELSDIDYKFSSDLAQLEPFGNQNPQPIFLVRDVTQLKAPQLLKDKHLKCTIFAGGVIKPVIFFNRPDLYRILKEHEDRPFSLACHIMKNEWEGVVKTELQGLDILLD